MRLVIVGGVTGVLTYIITEIIFHFFDFTYNVFMNDFNLLSVVIDFGSYIGIFLLIFYTLKKVFIKE
ncbi:hypothetical protein SAMN04490247_0960 [Salimicrobium halophilum]|uniref:Uncharacterized protein n=1 Tax=Salimicrobium halophilum TaxID=86666 RepID=A0A1G8REQ8_9BACI|nr:hypothetical protein SAMN04490247_0960 [Salimicrobium halophilum]